MFRSSVEGSQNIPSVFVEPCAPADLLRSHLCLEIIVTVYLPIHEEFDCDKPIHGLLLGSLSKLIRQRKTWSPMLLPGVLWRSVSNIARHRQILEVLKYPEYAYLARSDPRFAFKYLTHGYLVKGFTVAERATCFTHHYRWLHDNLPSEFLKQILQRAVPIVEIREGDQRFGIAFGFSRTHDKEGELSLNLEVNGETVFILSFNIVPGNVVKSSAADVLLITRMQGSKGCFRQISMATRAMRYVAPPALLMAALQGLGDALGIRTVACISGKDQNSYCPERAALFRAAYDAFFIARGMTKNEANFFLSPIPMSEKPLGQIKRGHKLRAKRRREFKRLMVDASRLSLLEKCHGHDWTPLQVRMDRIPRIA